MSALVTQPTLHLHHLLGCAPAPLAHYLKALGILRIVAEQRDPQARGWWQDEHFCLLTVLDRAALERFLLEDYSPTAFVSPWNKGSGFFDPKDPALLSLEQSRADRFTGFRVGIVAARGPLSALTAADAAVRLLKGRKKAKKGMSAEAKAAAKALKHDSEFKRELSAAERDFKSLKADLFTPIRLAWRGSHRDWLDAAMVLPDQGKPSWPALLGSGGNDGRLDFTNNAMQRLGELFDVASPTGISKPGVENLVRQALWGVASKDLVAGAPIGQFFPGGAGGANSSTGADGNSLINGLDFILMLEGSILFSACATRRLDPNAASQASSPFAVRTHGAGNATRGREKSDRGEQWMPLWTRPTTNGALQELLGEARLQLGNRVASRPLDVTRAIARLGVARGITSFVRYGYLERNGQSKFAVPVGRVDVRSRPHARLIDDLAPWLDRLQRLARDDHASARLLAVEGRLSDSVFYVLTHDDSVDRWQGILRAAADVESLQASGTAFKAGPIPALGPEWLAAADDGSPEWRLACALGSATASYAPDGAARDPVRHHWLPLQPGGQRFQENEKRLAHDVRVVATGRDDVSSCVALVERRLIEGGQRGVRSLPLIAARGYEARLEDLALLVAGEVDLSRTLELARALMAVRWNRAGVPRWRAPSKRRQPDEAWMALRLASLPWALEDGRTIPVDTAMIRRLAAGDGTTAVDLALRRLRACGLRPPLYGACVDENTALLWGASLAFPIRHSVATAMVNYFQPKPHTENR